MIDNLVKHLKAYREACDLLHNKYPNLIPPDFYVNAKKAVYKNGPDATCEFFKLVNAVKRDSEFPESGLDYDSMIKILEERKEEIEARIEQSKEEKELYLKTQKGQKNLHEVLLNALDRIRSTSELALMYYRAGQHAAGEL